MAAGAFAEAGADLELVGINKRFPGFTAIEDLDLTIPAGSFFALLGPSGCGKTTTLRLIAGLEQPTAGSIRFQGREISELSARQMKPLRSSMQMIFQDPYASLNPRKRVCQIVGHPMRLNGIEPRPGVRAAV